MEKQTPLIDLLERVPRDAVLVVEHDQFDSSSYPIGRLCHEAAAELRRLHAESERDEALLRQALEALEQIAKVKEPDLWRCTVCGRVGTVGRCCGEETREPVSHAVLSEGISNGND